MILGRVISTGFTTVKAQLVDDAYYILEPEEGVKLSLAIGREGLLQGYSDDELVLMRQIQPVVEAFVLRYWQQLCVDQQFSVPERPGIREQVEAAFTNFGRSMLTEREREVAHLLLRGHSSKSAAKKLDISPDTVQMHRKNMYAKLDLTSQSELFSLFIAALTHAEGELEKDPLEGYIQ